MVSRYKSSGEQRHHCSFKHCHLVILPPRNKHFLTAWVWVSAWKFLLLRACAQISPREETVWLGNVFHGMDHLGQGELLRGGQEETTWINDVAESHFRWREWQPLQKTGWRRTQRRKRWATWWLRQDLKVEKLLKAFGKRKCLNENEVIPNFLSVNLQRKLWLEILGRLWLFWAWSPKGNVVRGTGSPWPS